MALFASEIIPWIEQRFLTSTGAPLNAGKVYTYIAGTSTPKATYTDVNLTVAHANPIILNSVGRPPSPIFLSPAGYKFIVKDSADVEQYTIDNIENVGQVFASTFGNYQSEGTKNASSGYTVLSTDRLVTVNGGTVNLLAAGSATQMLAIKNVSTTTAITLNPNGADTIEGSNSAYTIPVASGTSRPTILLVSDGVSAWHILASHKNP